MKIVLNILWCPFYMLVIVEVEVFNLTDSCLCFCVVWQRRHIHYGVTCGRTSVIMQIRCTKEAGKSCCGLTLVLKLSSKRCTRLDCWKMSSCSSTPPAPPCQPPSQGGREAIFAREDVRNEVQRWMDFTHCNRDILNHNTTDLM